MKIQNRLLLTPIDTIRINEVGRQRKSAPPTPASCYEFALSLAGPASPGLLHPIGIREDNELLFGERRFTAFKLLAHGSPDLTEDQNATLRSLVEANPMYEKWTKIPSRIVVGADHIQSAAAQFIENAIREDLPFADRAEAAWKIHLSCLESLRERNRTLPTGAVPERWDDKQTAALLGISPAWFKDLIKPMRDAESAPAALQPKLKEVLKKVTSAGQAKAAVATIMERHGEAQKAGLSVDLTNATVRAMAKPVAPPVETSPILCADFTQWALTYEGEPFNFIHCDFPYGVEFNVGGGQNTNIANKTISTYDDSAEVYWRLLETLVKNRQRLVAPSAHILFWFSQNWRRETEDFFAREWPEAVVSKFLLVWHCSDNSGLLPTPREGRRTYETALQITIGDRPLAGPKAMSFSFPRNETKIHRSQKHLAVLEHFMGMYVDSSSRVLDPTCGSGSSIVTARRLGAKHFLGLELDPEMAALAAKFVEENK